MRCLVAAALLCGCSGAHVGGDSGGLAASHVELLYDGTDAPLEVLATAPRITAVLRPGALGPSTKEATVFLASGESAELAADGSRFVRTTRLEGAALPRWSAGTVALPAGWRLLVRSAGELAWFERAPLDTLPAALWHSADATREIAAPGRVLWADASDDGSGIVLGLERETRLLRMERALETLPAASAGRLSPDGRWIALESGGRVLVRTLVAPLASVEFASQLPAEKIVFSTDSSHLAWVSSQQVRVFVREPELRQVFAREASGDQSWSDAAFANSGTLALGSIQDVQQGFRRSRSGAAAIEPSATIRIERHAPGFATAAEPIEFPVRDWNSRSPELAFAGERLLVTVWPSAYEVLP